MAVNGDSLLDSGWHRLRQVILLEASSIVAVVVRRQEKEARACTFRSLSDGAACCSESVDQKR